MSNLRKCHDCGCREGELHAPGCDMECCPFCGGQLISCNCAYKRFYKRFKPSQWVQGDGKSKGHFVGHPTEGLPKVVYEKGLPEKVAEKWDEILEREGRIPYIIYPNLCVRCGVKWPKMFSVPDVVWVRYVAPAQRAEMLCRRCFDSIRRLIDEGC